VAPDRFMSPRSQAAVPCSSGFPTTSSRKKYAVKSSAASRTMRLPAVLFTWFWMTGMMNSVNLIDGMNGLVTGVVAITGIFITIISFTLKQYGPQQNFFHLALF
jgi:UDP-N-acetylmuramyl pentapeptide phosphotransferase/UDP-N-acetylglucosamine-1-phosphate transferase